MVYDLAIEFLKMGHIVTVVCPKGSNIPGAELIMPCDPNFANPEQQAYEAYKGRLDEFDIVEDHSWSAMPYLHKMTANPNLKLVHMIHSMQPWNSAPPVPNPCLLGASKYHAELISSWSGKHAQYCYHGIDLDTYKYCDKKEDYLLFVARITPAKGAHEFIALCRRLGLRGYIVGEDVYIDDPKYVRSIMDMCDGRNVIYYGRVPRGSDLMVELMGHARAVVSPLLPNYGEIFGLTTIESAACGTCFISTDRGAPKELIINGKTGFVVPTVFELDQAVRDADKIRPEDCRKQAERFSRRAMAEGHLAKFKMVLAGKEW